METLLTSAAASWDRGVLSLTPRCLTPASPPLQIFSIFAFATTGGYVGTSHFSVTCNGTVDISVEARFSYPFR